MCLTGRKLRRWAAFAGVVLAVTVLVSGCATTRKTRQAVQPSGFLGDYSQLREGSEKGDPQLIFIDPASDFSKYHSVIIESITLWESPDAATLDVDDRQLLTDYLFKAFVREFQKSFTIAANPAPGVLMLRAAITEAGGAKVVANTITSVVPQLRLLTTAGGMATDAAVLVGDAAIEVEIRDSVTFRRVAAGVDRRAGTKAVRGGITTWSDAKGAFDYWADVIHRRLVRLRDQDSN